MRIYFSTILLIIGASIQVQAQVLNYKILGIQDENPKVKGLFDELESGDSANLIRSINKKVIDLRGEGYLLANLDEAQYGADSTLEIFIHVGTVYDWAELSIFGLPEDIESKLAKKPGKYSRRNYSSKEVQELLMEIISYSENHGYPFASVQFDSIKIHPHSISAKILYDSGPFITFDSLDLHHNGLVKRQFLGAYLRILPGKAFDQREIDQMTEKLELLPYVNLEEAPYISFQNELCQVHISLKHRRSNQFDGIIGIFPNEKEGDKLLITGKVDLKLNNLFKAGKSLELQWDRIQVQTQSLILNYMHPNIFSSPLGLNVGLHLYKQDTLFNTLTAVLGANYLTNQAGLISLFSKWESSRLNGTSLSDSTQQLTDLSDYRINYAGFKYSNLPSRLVQGPKSMWGAEFQSEFGKKTILKNSNFNEEAYDGIDLEITQMTGEVFLMGLLHLSGPIFGYARFLGGKMVSDRLFLNELYRLGGLNSIRGFNEYNFYASEYIIGTLELRVYLNNFSNLFLLYDQSYLSYDLEAANFSDTPFGIGAGMNLQTDNGQFVLVFALGKSQDQPLDLRFSKIHFGYVATF